MAALPQKHVVVVSPDGAPDLAPRMIDRTETGVQVTRTLLRPTCWRFCHGESGTELSRSPFKPPKEF